MKEFFSNKFKALRKQRGLTQEQLAAEFGVTVQAVSKWETGMSYPDIELLPQIASYFGVSLDSLLNHEAAPELLAQQDAIGGPACPDEAENGSAALEYRTQPEAFVQNCNWDERRDDGNRSAKWADTPKNELKGLILSDLPDDGVMRVFVCMGNRVMDDNEYDKDVRIPIELVSENSSGFAFNARSSRKAQVNVYGSADILGNVDADISALGSVHCADVGGDISAGGNVYCGEISGDASAGGGINCGDVDGDVSAGGDISCGNIDGDLRVGGSIKNCGNINGDVTVNGGALNCGAIKGDVSANGSVSCDGGIEGDVSSGGSVTANGSIKGDVSAGGSIKCSEVKGDVNGGFVDR